MTVLPQNATPNSHRGTGAKFNYLTGPTALLASPLHADRQQETAYALWGTIPVARNPPVTGLLLDKTVLTAAVKTHLQYRKSKGARLARAGLCQADDVLACISSTPTS